MQDERLPEDALFEFLIANLYGREDEIRPLIIEHPDADLLWQGAYPKDVADLLVEQYHGMEIARIQDKPDRVLLQCSASPIPLEVVMVDGAWRVDASPIIDFRKRARDQNV
jgi:hypothetical protein